MREVLVNMNKDTHTLTPMGRHPPFSSYMNQYILVLFKPKRRAKHRAQDEQERYSPYSERLTILGTGRDLFVHVPECHA